MKTKWKLFCKRTDDPKLSVIEQMLRDAGITCKREGRSFHAPCLYVPYDKEQDALNILAPIDHIADDDPMWKEILDK